MRVNSVQTIIKIIPEELANVKVLALNEPPTSIPKIIIAKMIITNLLYVFDNLLINEEKVILNLLLNDI